MEELVLLTALVETAEGADRLMRVTLTDGY